MNRKYICYLFVGIILISCLSINASAKATKDGFPIIQSLIRIELPQAIPGYTIEPYIDGYYKLTENSTGHYGIVDTDKGNHDILPPKFSTIGYNKAVDNDYWFADIDDNQCALLTAKGKEIIPSGKYSYISMLEDDKYVICQSQEGITPSFEDVIELPSGKVVYHNDSFNDSGDGFIIEGISDGVIVLSTIGDISNGMFGKLYDIKTKKFIFEVRSDEGVRAGDGFVSYCTNGKNYLYNIKQRKSYETTDWLHVSNQLTKDLYLAEIGEYKIWGDLKEAVLSYVENVYALINSEGEQIGIHSKRFDNVTLSDNGKYLLCDYTDGVVEVYDKSMKNLILSTQDNFDFTHATLVNGYASGYPAAITGDFLFTTNSAQKTTNIHDLTTGKLCTTINGLVYLDDYGLVEIQKSNGQNSLYNVEGKKLMDLQPNTYCGMIFNMRTGETLYSISSQNSITEVYYQVRYS